MVSSTSGYYLRFLRAEMRTLKTLAYSIANGGFANDIMGYVRLLELHLAILRVFLILF